MQVIAAGQVDAELLLHRLAEVVLMQTVDQGAEIVAVGKFRQRERAGLTNVRKILSDLLQAVDGHEAGHHDIVVGIRLQRRRPEPFDVNGDHLPGSPVPSGA
ncbi:MAG: hypothetical protein ACMVY4_09640 [Minwuia sp.]|uniref:hypothetical protein n=1 Tax=Minwuia sp. TaxID=2493630 RepID=UPI003A8A7C6F